MYSTAHLLISMYSIGARTEVRACMLCLVLTMTYEPLKAIAFLTITTASKLWDRATKAKLIILQV